jgi:hypothetical protein
MYMNAAPGTVAQALQMLEASAPVPPPLRARYNALVSRGNTIMRMPMAQRDAAAHAYIVSVEGFLGENQGGSTIMQVFPPGQGPNSTGYGLPPSPVPPASNVDTTNTTPSTQNLPAVPTTPATGILPAATGFLSSIPPIVWIAGAGLLAYFMFFRKKSGAAS